MKYDPTHKQPRGIVRTQRAFSDAMFGLLAQKPFEKITVNELCQLADYPRATFYNYFDDKYDLIGYCWYCLSKEIHLTDLQEHPQEGALLELFAQTYRVFAAHQPLLLAIVAQNPLDSQLVANFLHHFAGVVEDLIVTRLRLQDTVTPVALVAKHYSNTVLLILEWIFLDQHEATLAEAEDYLKDLLTPPAQHAISND
ncbi:TetR/AcrR family transcriptional regulator [Lacticaseibacillus kribbianus]|uniref:TetR/AcrR family transcriptional regulator n=1 Tax=Lacticaseibacillus kribbianus TaxID=2926292 RepID=UPI001CD63BD2|nr:TetR/AcrR family transcriptional regulator [Lacticaseibacillus kribbianus]